MASHLSATGRFFLPDRFRTEGHSVSVPTVPASGTTKIGGGSGICLKARASATGDAGDSYLGMWKKARDRVRKEAEFLRIANNPAGADVGRENGDLERKESAEATQRRTEEFEKILEVPREERDRIQRMQVVDRAEGAIAAARDVLNECNSSALDSLDGGLPSKGGEECPDEGESVSAFSCSRGSDNGKGSGRLFGSYTGSSRNGAPGPNFWLWTPPPDANGNLGDAGSLQKAKEASPYPVATNPVLEKDGSPRLLSIPFESEHLESRLGSPIPPLESSLMVSEATDIPSPSFAKPTSAEENKPGVLFSGNAAEAADALDSMDEASSLGRNEDGSRWWRESGIEQRPDGVLCKWTLLRGVGAEGVVEWEEKFWEAADQFNYKELGSEKSGRDAAGNVWREYWRESMRQESGLVHFEKTADKWGENEKGDRWQEKWWEHYDSSGKAEKWADKWCSIDPNTHVEAGHAHVWHERWGEKYDGHGGSAKYTDKWAERWEGDRWAKWGDKWDEDFKGNGHGGKQGETWWEGRGGDQWRRTWGERHDGSGWVHKYGKSCSGEHWDTHVQQSTWFESSPHYGFWHCFENSVKLRQVQKLSQT